MISFKHIIWDWNGTIVDDAHLCIQSLNVLLAKRDLEPIDLKRYSQEFRFPVQDFYIDLGFDFSQESYNDVAQEFIDYYHKYRFDCLLRKDVVRLLNIFKSLNITQSILSAYRQDFLNQAVQFFNLHKFFNKIDGLDNNHACSKLDVGLKHIQSINIKPQNILYIGDTNHDVEVANKMGVQCILVESNHQSFARMKDSSAMVFANISDIIKYFNL